MVAPEELALDPLGRESLRNLFAGAFALIALALYVLRVPNAARWELSAVEAEALTDPAARMLHGRRKLQAAIRKWTDPGLFISAVGIIVKSRLAGASSPPRSRPAPAAGDGAAAAPAPPRADVAPPPAATPAPASSPQDRNLETLRIDPSAAENVLLDLQRSVMALG